MWLECNVWLVGGVVRRYIDVLIMLLIPTPLVLAPFYSSIPTFCSFLKCFVVLSTGFYRNSNFCQATVRTP